MDKEIKDKILEGMDRAFKKLVKEKSKDDRELIFSKDGKIIRVKARELEKKMGLDED